MSKPADTVTKLEGFLDSTGIKPKALATRASISRQHLLRLRKGRAEPTRDVMVTLTLAASSILRRRVFIAELFDLGESETLLYGLLVCAKIIIAAVPLDE